MTTLQSSHDYHEHLYIIYHITYDNRMTTLKSSHDYHEHLYIHVYII